MSKSATKNSAAGSSDVRDRILETASELFYRRGVRAVGVDLVVEKSGVAKTSLYRHFGTKDDLIAAFLKREDLDFWSTWDRVSQQHPNDALAELDAHFEWIGERVGRENYRGCPQINTAAEFPEADHPARKVAEAHMREMRRRLQTIAEGLAVTAPHRLAGQLAVLINGSFVSMRLFEPGEATGLLQDAARAMIAANRG
jgi:AcrR family transcriptional regulator